MGAVEQRTILLLENNEDDIFVFRRALLDLDFKGQMRVAMNVRQAREYLEDRNGDRLYFPLPDLIVADFGLDGERGSDFVRWLRERPEFAHIPVVFFSGSLPRHSASALAREFEVPVVGKSVDFRKVVGSVKQMVGMIKQPEAGNTPPGP